MPEVPGAPYEPIPTAEATERPIPLPEPRISGAAFGENIANAVRTFGGDVIKAGDEVAQRALALRQLQVDNQIRDLSTAYYNEMAPIQADFMTKQGNGASQDALNAHLAQMEQVRQKYVGQASQIGGMYGQKMFGDDAASLQRSFIREASIYSGTQTKRAAIDGNKASQDVLIRSFNSTDPRDFDQTIKNGERLIDQNGALDQEGQRPEMTADLKVKFRQDLREKQLTNIAWDRPEVTMQMLEDPNIQKDLGDKYSTVRKEVQDRYETVMGNRLALRAAEQVRAGTSEQDVIDTAVTAVRQDPIASKIPGMDSKIEQLVRGQVRGVNYDQQQGVNNAQQYIVNAITAPGANFRNLADLEASNPNIRQIEDQLRTTPRGALWLSALPNLIQHNWNVAHTDQMNQNFQALYGLSMSTDPVARQQFLQTSLDPDKIELKKADWQTLMRRRDYILKHPEEENPIVKRALTLANKQNGAALDQLGISRLTGANATKYHRFTGALSIEIQSWMDTHEHRIPSDKELDEEIIKPTLRQHWTGGLGSGHYFGTRRGAFEIDVPKEDMDKWKQLEAQRQHDVFGMNVDPSQISDDEAYFAAYRSAWDKLYGKPDGGNTTTVPKSR